MLRSSMTQNATKIIDDMWSQMCRNAQIDEDQAVYVLKDVSLIFGVSMSTVSRWSDAGTIRSCLLGPRKRVVSIQELKRYLEAQAMPQEIVHVAN